ncbi:MAG: GtrA family protein [Bacilli bacterium]|nr:GtrA family protein [Bacilli bacterium]
MIDKIKNNKLLVQIIKFVIVGGIATIIDFVVLYILKEYVGLNEILANTISFTVSVIYNYIASIKWVFDVDKDKNEKQQFIIFIVFSIIGLGINNLILWICIDKFNIHYLIGKVFATAIVMVFNFITRKKFLEKNN